MKNSIRIAWLYPDLMSTYGDRGNVIVLQKRCQWRGIQADIVPVTLETKLSVLESCDLIFMGGAQDRQQKLAGEDFLKRKGPVVKKWLTKASLPCSCVPRISLSDIITSRTKEKDLRGGDFDLTTEHQATRRNV